MVVQSISSEQFNGVQHAVAGVEQDEAPTTDAVRRRQLAGDFAGGDDHLIGGQPAREEQVDGQRRGRITAERIHLARCRAVAHHVEPTQVVAGLVDAAVRPAKRMTDLVLHEVHRRIVTPGRMEVAGADVCDAPSCRDRARTTCRTRVADAAESARLVRTVLRVGDH